MENIHKCPNCGDLMVPAEASLSRSWANVAVTGWGSSELRIKPRKGKRWLTHMTPAKNTQASYCVSCGALLLAPSTKKHRKNLGLE